MENIAEIIAITLREDLRSRSFFRSIRLSVILILLIFIFHSWHKNENCVCAVMTERGKGILRRSKETAPAKDLAWPGPSVFHFLRIKSHRTPSIDIGVHRVFRFYYWNHSGSRRQAHTIRSNNRKKNLSRELP